MMPWRTVLTVVMMAAVVNVLADQQQPPPPPPKESIVTKLLRIAGLTVAPTQMRGPGDDVPAGDIWIVTLDQRAPRPLTTDGGYRSPLVAADGTNLRPQSRRPRPSDCERGAAGSRAEGPWRPEAGRVRSGNEG